MARNIEVRIDDRKLQEIIRGHPQRAGTWLSSVAEAMVGDIKQSFGTGPAGRSYQRGQKYHIASQPGYPPNIDTNALRAGMRWENTGSLERTIMDSTEYGLKLEEGIGIAARPFVQPVFSAWRTKIGDDARRRLEIE